MVSRPPRGTPAVSRRRLLQFGVGAVAGTVAAAGCLGRRGGDVDRLSLADDAPPPLSDGPTTTPGDLPEWTPEWTVSFDGWNVLGLDAASANGANSQSASGGADDDVLYATLSDADGASAVEAIDPADRTTLWRREMSGEAVGGSHVAYGRIARGGWGVTPTDDALYAVAGAADEREWTALHAFDRTSGDRRWTFERERELAVAGVSEGLVVATGLEFFPPPDVTPTSHQTPEEPLTTVVYGIDAADGSLAWERSFTAVRDVAVSPRGVVVAAADGLVALDREGDDRFALEDVSARWVEIAEGRLFVRSGSGEGATLSGVAPNGDVDWRLDAPVEELLLDGDRLYAGGEAVLAVETDGTVAWRDDDYGQWLLLDPDGDTLYTRSGRSADAATAYDVSGAERWTFAPPSNNSWPETATAEAMVATAITGESADEPFKTVYAVDADGEATAALERDTVFDALGLDGTVYLADGRSNLLALSP
ncbi:outer membrane protein assembly factor BamB family protein [Halobellus rufus]|uniref:outer membrane protein assembly factor BamB family protein n=1 Tax=Halobellus rufus TaxID=1448860 RepID=UPI000679619B|nr:PQQ-binding-like beta-propeller repeat protein [Halobellus rufus]